MSRELLSKILPFQNKPTAAPSIDSDQEPLRLAKLFEDAGRGWFWSTDEGGCLTYISRRAHEILNVAEIDLLGRNLANLFTRETDTGSVGRSLALLLARRSSFENLEVRSAHRLVERWWSLTGVPQFDQSGEFIGFRGSAVDITDYRNASNIAARLAKFDPLTGLTNRLHIGGVIDAVLGSAMHSGGACAIIMIDLDRFKQINDTLGHPAGDQLLKQVADRLLEIIGNKEFVARLGGDEFQVVLPEFPSLAALSDTAARIIASLSEPYLLEGTRCTIGASLGIAVGPEDGRSPEELVRNADLALYASKGAGRGRFRFFSSDLLKHAEERRALEEDLRDAIENGDLSLEYQPIVQSTTNRVIGVEALIRWYHSKLGSISPAVFIPLAEETNLIGRIGEWAIRKACQDASEWPGRIRVAINVSPVQFADKSLPELVKSAIEAAGISPEQVELELTEGVLIGETPHTHSMFASLREVGVRLALDDFGTGYSSLAYLRSFRFDKIKIDQSFINAANEPGSPNRAIISAIITLADAMGMETTAEGIESLDQLEMVRSLGASHIQGFVYSGAVRHEELLAKLDLGDWLLAASGVKNQRSSRKSVYFGAGAIHHSRYIPILVRNLSSTGALVEGLNSTCVGDLLAINFGEGELVFAMVRRTNGKHAGVQFHDPLVSTEAGELRVQKRFSNAELAKAGTILPSADSCVRLDLDVTPEQLAWRLGCSLDFERWDNSLDTLLSAQESASTVREAALAYLQNPILSEDRRRQDEADLRCHILPRFGHIRLKDIQQSQVDEWLAQKSKIECLPDATLGRLKTVLRSLRPLEVKSGTQIDQQADDKRTASFATLSDSETAALLSSIRKSSTRVATPLASMVALTGAKTRDLLNLTWDEVDLNSRTVLLRDSLAMTSRTLVVSESLMKAFESLTKTRDFNFVFVNPVTKKPYRSVTKSWETISRRANISNLELDDLRFCLKDPDDFVARLVA